MLELRRRSLSPPPMTKTEEATVATRSMERASMRREPSVRRRRIIWDARGSSSTSRSTWSSQQSTIIVYEKDTRLTSKLQRVILVKFPNRIPSFSLPWPRDIKRSIILRTMRDERIKGDVCAWSRSMIRGIHVLVAVTPCFFLWEGLVLSVYSLLHLLLQDVDPTVTLRSGVMIQSQCRCVDASLRRSFRRPKPILDILVLR